MKAEEVNVKVYNKLILRPDTSNFKEEYLRDIICDAMNDTVDFINAVITDDIDGRLITPIYDLCVIRINLMGAEGLSSSSKAGTSETYADDLPKSIKAKLRKYRRLPS